MNQGSHTPFWNGAGAHGFWEISCVFTKIGKFDIILLTFRLQDGEPKIFGFNFLSEIGKKLFFGMGMGPNFGPKSGDQEPCEPTHLPVNETQGQQSSV